MSLTHGLLDAARVGVDDKRSTLGKCEEVPSTLEDMSYRQEGDYTVILPYRHALVVGGKGSGILSAGKHHAL